MGQIAPIVPRKTAWVLGGFAIVFLIAGGVSMWRTYKERMHWAPNDAQVNYSEVITFGDKSNPKYRLQSEFIYSVGHQRYLTPYSFPTAHRDRKTADQEAARYSRGSSHRVYYNVAQPHNMLLDLSSAKRFFLGPLLLTALGVVLGSGLLLMYLRSSLYFCVVCGASVSEQHAFCFHCGSRIPARKGKMMAS